MPSTQPLRLRTTFQPSASGFISDAEQDRDNCPEPAWISLHPSPFPLQTSPWSHHQRLLQHAPGAVSVTSAIMRTELNSLATVAGFIARGINVIVNARFRPSPITLHNFPHWPLRKRLVQQHPGEISAARAIMSNELNNPVVVGAIAQGINVSLGPHLHPSTCTLRTLLGPLLKV